MSQVGTILSSSGQFAEYGSLNWVVDFSYQLDAGGTAISRIIVGNNPIAYGYGLLPTSALWTSPASTITVNPNPPGTTNPVVLVCPNLVARAAGYIQ